MKYLGIDYGAKRIGLAVSDESGMMAFPRSIIENDGEALRAMVELAREESVGTIVVGNSIDASGARNEIMEDVDAFVEELHKLTGLPIVLHDERFSSMMARSFDFTKADANVASPRRRERVERIDDRAAAIMLQRYLDSK